VVRRTRTAMPATLRLALLAIMLVGGRLRRSRDGDHHLALRPDDPSRTDDRRA